MSIIIGDEDQNRNKNVFGAGNNDIHGSMVGDGDGGENWD